MKTKKIGFEKNLVQPDVELNRMLEDYKKYFEQQDVQQEPISRPEKSVFERVSILKECEITYAVGTEYIVLG